MRTLIRGGWIVGFQGETHALVRDGVVVFEDGRILHVGTGFAGDVDREIDAGGMLVAPGFIDMHVHGGHRASHRLITDIGRPDYFGQPFLEISVPREGTRPGGRSPVHEARPGGGQRRHRPACHLYGVRAAAKRRHHVHGDRQPAPGPGRAAQGSGPARRPCLPGPRLRLGPLGGGRQGPAQARVGRGRGLARVRGRRGLHQAGGRQLRRPGEGYPDPAGVRELHAGPAAGHAQGGGRAQGADIDPRGLQRPSSSTSW